MLMTIGNIHYCLHEDGTAEVLGLLNEEVTEVRIPGAIEVNGETYRVTHIRKRAFKNCGNLEAIVYPRCCRDCL